jgi:predicted RND superfamily exporter protein
MKWILGPASRLVSRRPWWAIGLVAALSAGLAVFAAQQQTDTDITAFAPDTDVGRAFTQLEQDMGASGSVQVILDAGEGNVISATGIRAVREVRDRVQADPVVVGALAPADAAISPIRSFAAPVIEVLEAGGIDPLAASDEQVAAAGITAYSSADAALAISLMSRDRDLAGPSARAGMVLIRFRPGLSDTEVGEAALAVKAAVEEMGGDGPSVEVFSLDVLFDDMQQTMDRELPPLLGLSFLLVVLILVIFYRRVSDVLIGVVGLMLAIMWMYGLGVLVGPDYLGWAGAFTQISIAIPVLLVGLGIDYAVHLTSRYREERSLGVDPPGSARVAMLTVGGALVLATVTTVVGFLTNLASPIPPVGDFGVFTALGVLASFVVMALLVPAVRNVLDRRAARRDARSPRNPLRPLTRVMEATTVLATRAPIATLLMGAAATVVSIVVASGLTTEFSQEEFIPEGSEAERLVAVVDELFGGDVVEETGIVMTGGLFDPETMNAMLEVEANLADTPDVRSANGSAQSLSPASAVLLARAVTAEEDPGAAAAFSDLGLEEAGFAPEADVVGLLMLAAERAPLAIGSVAAVDGSVAAIRVSTSAGEEGAAALARALADDASPLADAGVRVVVTSRNLLIAEVADTMATAQQRSIIVTLAAALLLLVVYYAAAERRPLLGVVTMIPSLLVVVWTLGTMKLMGLSFNVMTGTIASLAIGIGVPYGIHVTHRFTEDLERSPDAAAAVRATVGHTGAALAGAALTTAAGFGVLRLASIIPLQQFGGMTAITIVYSLLAAVLVQPSCLVAWERFDRWRTSRREQHLRLG